MTTYWPFRHIAAQRQPCGDAVLCEFNWEIRCSPGSKGTLYSLNVIDAYIRYLGFFSLCLCGLDELGSVISSSFFYNKK